MIHNRPRVDAIRQRVAGQLELLGKMDGKISEPDFLSQFRLAMHWLNDVEHLFLADLSRNQRSAFEESVWLAWTEQFVHMAEKQAAAASELFKAYGGQTI